MNKTPILKLNNSDDVVIARTELPAGSWLESESMETRDLIPAGHKIALRDIPAGSAVKRYGQIIGFATRDIRQGEHIHVHNLGMGSFERDYAWGIDSHLPEKDVHQDTFMGIDHRLLEIIACPVCNGKLWYNQEKQELICKLDNLAFPLRDGIPVLLETEARVLTADEGKS